MKALEKKLMDAQVEVLAMEKKLATEAAAVASALPGMSPAALSAVVASLLDKLEGIIKKEEKQITGIEALLAKAPIADPKATSLAKKMVEHLSDILQQLDKLKKQIETIGTKASQSEPIGAENPAAASTLQNVLDAIRNDETSFGGQAT